MRLAILPFSGVPYNRPIRFRENWWIRANYHQLSLMNFGKTKGKVQISISINTLVGILKKDLEKYQYQYIREEFDSK